jgi:hypothetical protein
MTELEPAPPILAIDPGPTFSTAILYSRSQRRVLSIWGNEPNDAILELASHELEAGPVPLCIEWIESMGMQVGAEVFDTCRWVGRFQQAYPGPVHLLRRSTIKLHLCGSRRAKDPDVRQALLDKFGPGRELAIGVKAKPGPLYGVSQHAWSALAVAVTFAQAPER